MKRRAILLMMAVAVAGLAARGDVTLFGLFTNNMVLQRDVKLPVWGRATPGERIAVRFNGQEASATADAEGQWRVELAPMAAGGPFELTVAGDNTVTLRDVLVGDVWLCGGQSNMVYGLAKALGADELLGDNLPLLRLVQAACPVRGQPSRDYSGGQWGASQTMAGGFSAVGYVFGRELHKQYGIPVGLIQCAAGGSVAEAWTPRDAMADNPALRDMVEIVDKAIVEHRARLEAWPAQFEAWLKEADVREKTGQAIPRPPGFGQDPRINPYRPAGMYNGGIAPLAQFPIKGVVWYQGESNGSFAYQYRELLPALIESWRAAWKQPEMPFLIVQLPTYRPQKVEPDGCSWAELREAQLMTWQRLANTGMAVTLDLGADPDDPKQDPLHPPNKIPMGQRLARVARAVAYGEDLVYSGPVYEAAKAGDGRMKLSLAHTGTGLMVKGDTLNGFTVAGEDRVFHPAQARLDGADVLVWSNDVPAPVAVRYNWAYEPMPPGNLYNREGLPASPFRTDDWPGITMDAKYWW